MLSRNGVETRVLHFPDDDHRLGGVECEAEVFVNASIWFRDHATHIPELP